MHHRRFYCLAARTAAIAVFCAVSSATAAPQWVKSAIEGAQGVSVDKDAPAFTLHHSETVEIQAGGKAIMRFQGATKILTRAGVDYADLAVSVRPDRKVKNVSGWLIRATGKEEKLEKDYIIEVDHDYATGYYDDDRVLTATFPDVSPGDVVAYEYEVEEKDPWTVHYHTFFFQRSLPVRSARFEVVLPKGWDMHTSGQNIEPVVFEQTDKSRVWSVSNLPYRPSEDYMPRWNRLYRRLRVGAYDPSGKRLTHADWNSVASYKLETRRESSVPGAGVRAAVDKVCAGLTTKIEKVRAVAEYVRDEIRYVAVELGSGRFVPRDAETTLSNRYGDCKDKTALMQAMLRVIGVHSAAVNACIGYPVDPDFPSLTQFDHIIIAIPVSAVPELARFPASVVDGWFFFDPTDEETPFGMLSLSLRDSNVLKLTENDTATCHLPASAPEDCRRVYRVQAHLHDDFSVEAEARILDYGIWGAESAYEYTHTSKSDLVKEWQERLGEVVQNVTIANLETGSDGDSAWVAFKLTGSDAVTSAGDYLMLKADLMHRDRPDDLTAKTRCHPISFGSPAIVMTDVDWTLPEGWTADDGSRPIEDSCALAVIKSTASGGDGLSFKSDITYFGGELPVDQYPAAQKFNRSLRAAQKTRVFLTRGKE